MGNVEHLREEFHLGFENLLRYLSNSGYACK